jgi:hypothetical protein
LVSRLCRTVSGLCGAVDLVPVILGGHRTKA